MPGRDRSYVRTAKSKGERASRKTVSSHVSPESERRLRDAMDLLLSGKRNYSNGRLTVVALAKEARVSRSTAIRAAGVLKAFEDAVKALRDADDATHPVVVVERLQQTLVRERAAAQARIQALEEWKDTLAQQVQALTLLLERERAAGPRTSEVIPITASGRRSRDPNQGKPSPDDRA